ncbi:rhomboid family intramembrane serine protease [Mucilaginibacter sabulilitoris]|uniref:Rhomboid family intramembrane serine protease n=1 Tax=Mucilaginibacter sabulilitoris TaxID=1173583 RepID=A0ABZ0TNM1_9SPHI|nr:rhomboid family intramembrane serine protease [Mucilaginibacter sabulilitoris]WPU94042.1 rhomboid family intramembrane serine protease [Mucilaginibacter sabulilitoris]
MNSQSPFANLTVVVKNLLIINLICFLPYILFRPLYLDKIILWFGGYYFNSSDFRPWQIITYMFLHGGWEHIFFNMFALFSFGPIVEYALGAKRFFNFYFLCGIGAILCQMAVQAFEVHGITGGFTIAHPELQSSFIQYGEKAQSLYDLYHAPIVGASGAIFGLLIAFGMLFPNMELMMLFIPVPIKAKYIIPVYVVVELFLGVKQFSGDSVAHFAHLGGAIIGYIMVKVWRLQRPNNFY